MRVALVKPPHQGSLSRGVGFYAQRLFDSLSKKSEISLEWMNLSFNPLAYQKFDLVHFPYFDFTFSTLPPVRLSKTVVTVHDMTPLVFPGHFPFGNRAKIIWPIQKKLLSGVDAVLTDSNTSKNDITKIAGISKEKVTVTYLAADPAFKKITDTIILYSIIVKYKLPEKFVLYVGGVNWNKNLPTLIQACQQINIPLVIVGKEALGKNLDLNHAESQSFQQVLDLIKNDTKILRLGFVPTEDLVGIYNLAKVYVQPSFYEGFGLPVLEAMGCGTPVICGKNSSLIEIAGDAATFADVTSVDDLADKIVNVKKTGKEILQAQKFTWEKTAGETLKVYEKVLASR